MEITHFTKDTLVLEDKRSLARVFILAFGGAGILLTLSSIQEYGFQAWYRLTHWGGALMAISGAAVYLRRTFVRKTEFSAIHGEVRISELRGFSWQEISRFPLDSITGITIERKRIGPRQLYRLVLEQGSGRIPLQKSFSQDFVQVEQAAKAAQRMLG